MVLSRSHFGSCDYLKLTHQVERIENRNLHSNFYFRIDNIAINTLSHHKETELPWTSQLIGHLEDCTQVCLSKVGLLTSP